jgi:hypothetical protein
MEKMKTNYQYVQLYLSILLKSENVIFSIWVDSQKLFLFFESSDVTTSCKRAFLSKPKIYFLSFLTFQAKKKKKQKWADTRLTKKEIL